MKTITAVASTRRTLFAWTSTFALATAALSAAAAFALGPTLSRMFMWNAMPATTMFLLGAAIAGATHGFLVGTGQARVLRRRLPRAPAHWTFATASGAAVAWTACMVLNLGGVAASLSDRTWHELVVAGGLGFGSVVGVAQWLALRRALPGAIWWIPANAVAWLLASAVIIAGIPLAERTEPTLASSALVLVTGFVASLVAAVIPGFTLAALATRAERIDAARIRRVRFLTCPITNTQVTATIAEDLRGRPREVESCSVFANPEEILCTRPCTAEGEVRTHGN